MVAPRLAECPFAGHRQARTFESQACPSQFRMRTPCIQAGSRGLLRLRSIRVRTRGSVPVRVESEVISASASETFAARASASEAFVSAVNALASASGGATVPGCAGAPSGAAVVSQLVFIGGCSPDVVGSYFGGLPGPRQVAGHPRAPPARRRCTVAQGRGRNPRRQLMIGKANLASARMARGKAVAIELSDEERDRSPAAARAGRAFAGHQAEEAHQLPRVVEAGEVAELGQHRDGGQQVDARQRHQRMHDRGQGPVVHGRADLLIEPVTRTPAAVTVSTYSWNTISWNTICWAGCAKDCACNQHACCRVHALFPSRETRSWRSRNALRRWRLELGPLHVLACPRGSPLAPDPAPRPASARRHGGAGPASARRAGPS